MTAGKDSARIAAAPPAGPADPAALTVDQLARLLGADVEKIREHIAAGAPSGPGGRVNLVHYAAWLNRQLREPDGD